jgi:parallel beta-helix repeat protein
MKSASLFRRAVATALLAGLTIAAAATAHAQTQPRKCSSQITSCGCTITATGRYTIENTLDYSQGLTPKNACIDITASQVDLYAYNYITGPGTDTTCGSSKPKKNAGIGIHVMPGATNVSIFLDDHGVCGWNYGLESEGSNVNWYDPGSYYNNVGMLLNNATGNDVIYGYFAANITGLEMVGGSGNSINAGVTYYNTQYGYWLNGTKGNTITSNDAYGNTIAGIYLGCNSKGDVKPLIPCTTTTTTGNSVQTDYAYGYDSYPQKYGIAVERGSIDNTFLENGTGYYYPYFNKVDIIDGNGNCLYNTYLDDIYLTKSPKCIQ